MANAFTVDVEDYFQVEAFARVVDRSRWQDYSPRVEENTRRLLELLARSGTRGTFFVLGWVAQRYPALVREIAAGGHEVASHGWSHRLIYTQTPQEFREETRKSKSLLEDVVQAPVVGYRAATYSITGRSLWALDVLVEEGFKYDSSIFPMRHDRYGIPDANPLPHRLRTPSGAVLAEFPISVLHYLGATLPIAGGGYFRLLPYSVTRWAWQRMSGKKDGVFYIHPWEIDPTQPRVHGASLLSKFRHYVNLSRCHTRLELLLADFRFTTMHDCLRQRGLV